MPKQMRLLIAYDGTKYSEFAINDLKRAGLPDKAKVLVAAVTGIYQAIPEIVKLKSEEDRKLVAKASDEIRRLFPKWRVEYKIFTGDPASEVVEIAKSWGADLIVIGSHGRSLVGRLFFGSVSHEVLIHSPYSVRIGREPVAARKIPERIIVGVDGSASAEAALETVKSRKWPKGSEVRVIAVNDPGYSTAVTADSQIAEEHMRLKRVVKLAVEALCRAGLHASGNVKGGDPKKVLTHEAKKWNADCIFVGTRGLGGAQRLFLGSVSEAVATHAPCSVEVAHCEGSK